MLKKPLFSLIFLLILAIAVIHKIALTFYFYWAFDWFDIFMHFLGGFWFGLAAVWTYFYSGYVKHNGRYNISFFISLGILSSLGVGILWELFEYFTGQTFVLGSYPFDLMLDLVMDTIGGILAAIFLFFHCKTMNRKA